MAVRKLTSGARPEQPLMETGVFDHQGPDYEPPKMFSWAVVTEVGDPPRLGAVGVCGDRDDAVRRLVEALKTSPIGAFGLVHRVQLGAAGGYYGYRWLLAKARRVTSTRVVVEEWGPVGLPASGGGCVRRRPGRGDGVTGVGVLGSAPAEGLVGDLRQALVEKLAGLLRGRGYPVEVQPLGLTVTRDGRRAEMWALCRAGDGRVWFCQPGAPFWVCQAVDLEGAARHLQQQLALAGERGSCPPTAAGC